MAFGDAYKRKVSYYYDREIGSCFYGENHPMKPRRLLITHELIVKYGLYQRMDVYKPYKASAEDMKKFHSEEYVGFLQSVNVMKLTREIKGLMSQFEIGTKENDCPIFEGLFKFAQISVGASLAAASHIINGTTDIAINWSGGLHHAKKSRASGFCYINDIVLCILELLKYRHRVLYVDIDIHHADGVEEAFYATDRVMTVSFHRYGNKFFPGTGGPKDNGYGKGKGYSVNVPLKAGITDCDYEGVFVTVMSQVMQVYSPDAIVMQCGSDSIAGDQLGDFNLTLNAHGRCIRFMRDYNIPMILLGGGGYTVENVSRCWCYDTSIALNEPISNVLPENIYLNSFKPLYRLHINPDPELENENGKTYLNNTIMRVFENLRCIDPVPSVHIQATPSVIVIPDSPSPSSHESDASFIVISDDEE